ncbi:hypothetical protein JTE90_007687 [Oedothorax gibbosus]|uniref:Insulin-like growth factor-binding protein complex acid labile subunit n=1 Tax=Oedothorax gibbosus TaxID=931172 RepID=A0AAV6ULR9_9ARAC|nr:hypothetical protein JTE90_007687 [Oedothorax gibbosus]
MSDNKMKLQILFFASFVLVEGHMPEHYLETRVTAYDNFVCPPDLVLRPCQCTTVPDIPTVHCGGIRSLKTVHINLRAWFQDDPIPYLKFVDAQFEGLPSRAFVSVNVTRLQIRDSNLKWIAPDAFAGMRSLLLLTLHNVALFNLPYESLSQLPSLVSLRLPGNKLHRVSHSDLGEAFKLKYLSLAGNKLTHVDRGSFPIILVTLSLSNNCIRSLNKSIRYLVNLEWLFLNDNRLLRLEGELDGLHSLKQLNLAKNSIGSLGRSFRDLKQVQELYLQYNAIHELGTSLHNLSQLRNLNLSMNRLGILSYTDFDGLTSLEGLDLSGNRLTEINGAFNSLTNLRRLDLSKNRLRHFSFDEISPLTKLTILDLCDNRLHRFSPLPAMSTLPVERVFLARNKLSSLGQFLRHFTVLEAVDISFNHLRILKAEDFTMSPRIDYVSVAGNPLLCDEEQMLVYHELDTANIEVDGRPTCDDVGYSAACKNRSFSTKGLSNSVKVRVINWKK